MSLFEIMVRQVLLNDFQKIKIKIKINVLLNEISGKINLPYFLHIRYK